MSGMSFEKLYEWLSLRVCMDNFFFGGGFGAPFICRAVMVFSYVPFITRFFRKIIIHFASLSSVFS